MKATLLYLVICAVSVGCVDRLITDIAGCASEKECAEVTPSALIHSNVTQPTK